MAQLALNLTLGIMYVTTFFYFGSIFYFYINTPKMFFPLFLLGQMLTFITIILTLVKILFLSGEAYESLPAERQAVLRKCGLRTLYSIGTQIAIRFRKNKKYRWLSEILRDALH